MLIAMIQRSSVFIFLIVLLCVNIANAAQIWKSTYYGAIPNKPGISPHYCQQREPGTFIGNVDHELKWGVMTNRHIFLNHFTFHVKIKNGIYFIRGHLIAEHKTHQHFWRSTIHYIVYKLTMNGVTRGVWFSRDCKGFYVGRTVKK